MVHDPPNGHSTRQKVINIWVFNVVGRIRVLPSLSKMKLHELDSFSHLLAGLQLCNDFSSVNQTIFSCICSLELNFWLKLFLYWLRLYWDSAQFFVQILILNEWITTVFEILYFSIQKWVIWIAVNLCIVYQTTAFDERQERNRTF